MPPLMVLSLTSTENLEITVTKTLLNVLNTLVASFSEITASQNKEIMAPIIVKNVLGKSAFVHMEYKDFRYIKYGEKHTDPEARVEVIHGQDVQLSMFRGRSKGGISYVSPLQEQSEQAEAFLKLDIKDERGYFEIPVCKADKRFFHFNSVETREEINMDWYQR